MSDSIALARLLFARSRSQLLMWSAWTAVSISIAFLAAQFLDSSYVLMFLFLSTFPAMLWSLAMFEFGNPTPMHTGESGYSHWLLRMPIADWQLGYVPLVMRFVWITLFYMTLVVATGLMTGVWLPIWTGLILFWAGGAWMSGIAWRPFRGFLRRVFLTIVVTIAYYILFTCVMSVHFDDRIDITFLRDHPLLVKSIVAIFTFAALGSGVWIALQSLKLARTNSLGLVPEQHNKVAGWLSRINSQLSPDATKVTLHSSGPSALAWHDIRRMLLANERWLHFFMIVGIIVLASFLPLPTANALFLFFLLTSLGVMTGSSVVEPTSLQGSSLPPYIAASPLSCAQIGFTRGINGVRTTYVFLLGFGLAYGVCLVLPYNQRILSAWIDDMAAMYGSPSAAYRWMAVVLLTVIAMVPSRSLGFTWPTMTGRSRLAMVALTLPTFAMLGAVAMAIAWFLKQAKTDWETVIANAWYWAGWIPTLLAVLIVVKFTATVITASITLQKGLLSPKTAARIATVWVIATILFATLAHGLIPDDRIRFAWTLMVATLLLPLGRVLVLPYAVYLNRYR